MLHAAAMLIGLFALALLVIGDPSPTSLVAAAVIALFAVLLSARLGGVSRAALNAPHLLGLWLAGAGAAVRGALVTIRNAAAADVTLKPALVRVKTRASGAFARAALADVIGASPEVVVVEADADSTLIHVNDEDRVDAVEIGVVEARVLAAFEPGAPA
jgi:multisubunit Na+/H+ antiporter MnhE subunit